MTVSDYERIVHAVELDPGRWTVSGLAKHLAHAGPKDETTGRFAAKTRELIAFGSLLRQTRPSKRRAKTKFLFVGTGSIDRPTPAQGRAIHAGVGAHSEEPTPGRVDEGALPAMPTPLPHPCPRLPGEDERTWARRWYATAESPFDVPLEVRRVAWPQTFSTATRRIGPL